MEHGPASASDRRRYLDQRVAWRGAGYTDPDSRRTDTVLEMVVNLA